MPTTRAPKIKETMPAETTPPSDPPPPGEARGLFAKLLVAQTAASGVGKQGRNEAQGYSYARAEDVIAEAQKALQTGGLVGYLVPGEVEQVEVQSNQGSSGLFVTLHAELVIVDPESPVEGTASDELRIPARGTGIDYPGDKAIYKALTGASKYAYSSALGIPFGDDPEDSGSSTAGQDSTRRRSGGAVASAAQKRAITTILNKVGVTREEQAAIVHGIAGDPPTKAGASEILDVIAGVDRDDAQALIAAVDRLKADERVQVPSVQELPPADDADLKANAEAAAKVAEAGDEIGGPVDTGPVDPSGGDN